MTKTLQQILDSHDTDALELWALRFSSYHDMRSAASEAGVDLDDLEELLAEI